MSTTDSDLPLAATTPTELNRPAMPKCDEPVSVNSNLPQRAASMGQQEHRPRVEYLS